LSAGAGNGGVNEPKIGRNVYPTVAKGLPRRPGAAPRCPLPGSTMRMAPASGRSHRQRPGPAGLVVEERQVADAEDKEAADGLVALQQNERNVTGGSPTT